MTGLTPSTLTRRHPALWRALGLSLTLLAITHVLVWLLGIWSVEIINNSQTGSLWQSFAMWNRWDTPHYLDLARHGYSNHGELGLFIVFFPAYPALVRVLTPLTGDAYMSALLISLFSALAACVALHQLVRHYRDVETADRAVWYLLIFPTAYFLHIGYTEALFMATLLWLWVALIHQRWLLVGGLGMLLCATRINGMLIGLVVGWEIMRLWQQQRRFDPAWLWTALIPCGLAVYLAINWWLYDNALHFLEVQRGHWHKAPGTPLTALADLWQRLEWDKSRYWTMGVFELAAVALGLIASIFAFWRLGVGPGLWSASNLLLMTSTGWALSLPRYILVIFPLFILMAELARTAWLRAAMDVLCLAIFTTMAIEFAHGHWAF
ncbi:putative integral membrane protein [Oceanococcus atlanticus]|uniref:Putative integral membrane protein n=1 Tax=Oceanococcus atlanticus TaxID=1317117 RepID=A0A1Y1SGS1_9GAMM|nr:hypothetical protein [Oceanococcus atlanticus]ORE88590.1 putative integral membrane protein [Oceanococcus atlanticus]